MVVTVQSGELAPLGLGAGSAIPPGLGFDLCSLQTGRPPNLLRVAGPLFSLLSAADACAWVALLKVTTSLPWRERLNKHTDRSE